MSTLVEKLTQDGFATQKHSDKNTIKKTKPKSMRTLHAEAIKERIAAFTASKIDPILEAMELSATGKVYIEKETDKGVFREQRAPDVNAARLLLEHAGAKPKEELDVKMAIGIVQLVKQLEDDSIQD